MTDTSLQAMQQAQQAQQIHQNHVRHHREAHDIAQAQARHPGAPQSHRPLSHSSVRGGGLRGLLALLAIVAVVYVARDPELRTSVETLARHLLAAHVQSG